MGKYPRFTSFFIFASVACLILEFFNKIHIKPVVEDFSKTLKTYNIFYFFASPFQFRRLDIVSITQFSYYYYELENKHFEYRLSNFIFIYFLIHLYVGILSFIFNDIYSSLATNYGMLLVLTKISSEDPFPLFQIINIPLQFVPYGNLILSNMVVGVEIKSPIIGIFVGHIVFYLLFIYPVVMHKAFLKTPLILQILFDKKKPKPVRQANDDH